MERKEAISLLKELVEGNLAQPSLVVLRENKRGTFDLVMKAECDTLALKKFIAGKNLSVRENEKAGYCIIFKP